MASTGTVPRVCPICGSAEHSLFAAEKLDEGKLNEYSYASRKTPEFMRLELVKCSRCACVFAPVPPKGEILERAYNEAGYDSTEEADCAAATYAAHIRRHIVALPRKQLAVDVGAGNGALLPHLKAMGFVDVIGVEPSREAINAAPDDIRDGLVEGMFSPELLAGKPVSLFCSFATLEHVEDPLKLLGEAHELLEPGGMIAVSTHNYRGTLNRILGLRSPIVDIEHLQLFCPETLEFALTRCGFTDIDIRPFTNRYPIRYWGRLLPLPSPLKNLFLAALRKGGWDGWKLSFPVGNLFAVARKP